MSKPRSHMEDLLRGVAAGLVMLGLSMIGGVLIANAPIVVEMLGLIWIALGIFVIGRWMTG